MVSVHNNKNQIDKPHARQVSVSRQTKNIYDCYLHKIVFYITLVVSYRILYELPTIIGLLLFALVSILIEREYVSIVAYFFFQHILHQQTSSWHTVQGPQFTRSPQLQIKKLFSSPEFRRGLIAPSFLKSSVKQSYMRIRY